MNPLTDVLSDTDVMPFGKYAGSLMQDVPTKYLHYLWQQGFKDIKPESDPKSQHQIRSWKVAMYIRNTINGLKMEEPDLIWS